MAVSPTRALWTAHLQSTWNRTVQDMGSRQGLALYVFIALFALALLVPSGIGGLFLGRMLGQGILEAQACSQEGSTQALILGGALMALLPMGSLFGGERVLSWEASRIFPVRLRTLFLAELGADLLDLTPLFFACLATGLLTGVGLAKPSLLPLLGLTELGWVLTLLSLRQLAKSLQIAMAKRLKLALLLMAALTGLLTVVSLDGDLSLKALSLNRLLKGLELLPTVQSMRGLEKALEGRWLDAVLRQFPLLFLGLALALPAALLMRRESDPLHLQTHGKVRPERLWTFQTPVWGITRLFLHQLWAQPMARLSFVLPGILPLFMLLPMRMASHGGRPSPWSMLMVFLFQGTTMMGFAFNQFGLEGPGIKALFLLPLEARTLLQGKALGLGLLTLLHGLLLMIGLGVLGILRPALIPAVACLLVSSFFIQAGLGHWVSAWKPLRANFAKPMQAQRPGLLYGLTVNGCFLAQMLFLNVPTLLLAEWSCAAAFGFASLTAGLLAWFYVRWLLPKASLYLDVRREALVQALG